MTGFTALNFAQIIAPPGGAAPATAAPQAGPLSGGLANNNVASVGGGAPASTDIFTLLVNQGNPLPKQENFAPLGKKLPVEGPTQTTVDDSIDALQSVLTGLLLQQSAPAVVQTDTISGQQAEDVLVGGLQQVSQNSVASPDVLEGALTQSAKNVNIDQALQGKTLDAYRAGAALVGPEVGSLVDTNDAEALNVPLALTQGDPTKKETSGSGSITSLLKATEDSPATLSESIGRLKNLSALTPLPATEGKQKIGTSAAGNSPLDQLASLQASLAPVKPEVQKAVSSKSEAASVQNNNALNTPAPQAVAQTAQQQNLSQQFNQKKQEGENSGIAKVSGEQPGADDISSLQQAASHKADAAKMSGQDFASHLQKAAVSPVHQIAMQISKLPSGKQNITVQLDPADLGKVDVKLEWHADGKTHISISAERKETLEMLKGDMGSLQRSLADSGIKADAGSLQFSLKGQDGFAGQLAGNDSGKQNQQGMQTSDLELKQAMEEAALASRYVNLNNLLDLRV